MKAKFSNISIKAIFSTIPNKIINLKEQINTFYDGDLKKYERIKKTIGLDKRHIVDSKTTTLDLCAYSTIKLLESNIVKINEIDTLIFVTQTPDFMQPNNAHILHGKIGLNKNCACFEINAGCSGYVYGLFLSYTMIQNGARNVLLCVGDTISKIVNPLDSNTAPIFGDAGSTTLISCDNTNKDSYFSLHADGKGYENLIYPNSAFRIDNKEKYLFMNGAEIFNFSIDKEPKAINEILEFANTQSIDFIFFHQANAYIISNITKRLNIDPQKAPSDSISKYGNTSSASIPLAICHKLHNGFNKDLQIILSGFGVGLSWASALLTLKCNTIISKPLIYKENI